MVEVHEVHIGQELDAGDTEAELLRYKIVKGIGTVTSGLGGISAAIAKDDQNQATQGSTVEAENTTKMLVGSGSLAIWHADTFHVAAGLHYVPTPELRPKIAPGNRLTVELAKTPVDSLTWTGTIYFTEYSG